MFAVPAHAEEDTKLEPMDKVELSDKLKEMTRDQLSIYLESILSIKNPTENDNEEFKLGLRVVLTKYSMTNSAIEKNLQEIEDSNLEKETKAYAEELIENKVTTWKDSVKIIIIMVICLAIITVGAVLM